eukprot:GEMP01051440.1.p1 GENE.GEMP01051440.1~~GEMP01051440.1.p1  ORF type:complete len:105 (+),score=2.74 GEMP01051440.1:124-438(+)
MASRKRAWRRSVEEGCVKVSVNSKIFHENLLKKYRENLLFAMRNNTARTCSTNVSSICFFPMDRKIPFIRRKHFKSILQDSFKQKVVFLLFLLLSLTSNGRPFL